MAYIPFLNNAYFSAKVGIGTDSPDGILEVQTTNDNRYIRFKAPNGEERFQFYTGGTGNAAALNMYTSDGTTRNVQISAGGTSYFNAGNVGIGTTSPSRPLSVHRGTAGSAANFLHYTNATAFAGLYIDVDNVNNIVELNASGDTASTMAFQTGNAEKMRITSTGNVGIGTTSPAAKLHVFEAGTAMIRVDSGATSPYKAGIEFLRSSINGGRIYNDGGAVQIKLESDFGYDAANPTRGGFMFKTAPVTSGTLVDAVRIDARGYVGIGTTSPAQNFVVADATNGNGVELVPGATGTIQTYNRGTSTYTNLNIDTLETRVRSIGATVFNNGSGFSERMRITSAGNVGIGTTSPGTKLDVDGVTTSLGFRTDTANTNWSLISRDSAGNSPLYVQSANSNTGQWIARFNYGSTTANGGNNVLTVAKDSSYFLNTNVGIGTTSPSQRAVISGPDTAPSFNTTAPSSATLLLSNSDTGYGTYFGSTSSGTGLIQQRRQTSAVYYDLALNPYGGNVGIGTASPDSKLHVELNSSGATPISQQQLILENNTATGIAILTPSTTSGYLFFGDNNDAQRGYIVYSHPTDEMKFKVAGSERMVINSSGNVGIGTTSPQQLLHVYKSNAPAGIEIQGGLNTITAIGDVQAFIDFGTNDQSASGQIAGRIESLSEIANGAHNGLAFYTGQQSRTPYLQKAMQIRNTGAISFGSGSTAYGSSGQILKSNADASPTWVDASTVIGGPYLPLSGGTLTGSLAGTSASFTGALSSVGYSGTSGTFSASVTASGNSNSFGDTITDALTATSGTFTSSVTAAGNSNSFGATTFSGTVTIPSYIYHTGDSNTFFGFNSSDQWKVTAGGNVGIQLQNSGVYLYYGGNEKLRTTSTGISVTGQGIFTGNVGIGTTSPLYKLDVSGSIRAGGKLTYEKSAGSLSTTGYAVAGLLAGSNGNSCMFTFTAIGNNGQYQKVVYSCWNVSGTWNTSKVIDEGTNKLDIEASANASTITFTFKSRSGSLNYSPRVTIEASGHAINNTYA
jgi:hypothetical protein